MATKLRTYSGKVMKNKSLIFNCIFILTMFTLAQIAGITICFRFLSGNLAMTLVVMYSLNFILYKLLDF